MRGLRDEHKTSLPLAVVTVVCFDQHQAKKLTVRSRRGLQANGVHSTDLSQDLLHRIQDF